MQVNSHVTNDLDSNEILYYNLCSEKPLIIIKPNPSNLIQKNLNLTTEWSQFEF